MLGRAAFSPGRWRQGPFSAILDFERGISESLVLAQRAIELDPDDPWGHCAAGYAYAFSRRFGPAVEELTEALQRNPNFAFARSFWVLPTVMPDWRRKVIRQLEMATRLSPRDHTQAANLSVEGLCHFIAGRYAEAITCERRAVQLRPNFGTAWRTLAAASGLAGDLDLARTALSECKRLQPNVSVAWVEQYHPIVRYRGPRQIHRRPSPRGTLGAIPGKVGTGFPSGIATNKSLDQFIRFREFMN